MFNIKNLHIGTRLSILIAVSAIGFTFFSIYAFYTLNRVQVNGPLYKELSQNQNLIADILPPPSYIIESHLVSLQILNAVDHGEPAAISDLIQKFSKLQDNYESQHIFWVAALSSSKNTAISQALLVDSYQSAQKYYQIFNDKFVPAIQADQVERIHVIFDEELSPAYEAHRSAIDQVVRLQQDIINKNETDAQSLINRSVTFMITLAIVTILLAIVLGIFISRSVIVPIDQLTHTVNQIVGGDLNAQAPSDSTDEIGVLARAFNEMTSRLRNTLVNLEQRVADRTKALATSTEVSRRLSTILDQKKLVNEVVNQLKDSFGYYHTQIYFYDETGENLIMAGGTGEAGEMMLSQFHKVAKGRGLVGRAAEINQAVLVTDTAKNPEWLPNMLLPHTKSEVAIPISIGDEVLGVLDVQQNIVDGLKQEDIDSLQSIANQIAIALQNIQSTEIVTKRAAELQTVARISTVSATIGDVQKMLESVVHLTQRGFGLYHAHVFTYNENNERLEIVACGYKEGDEHEGTHGTTAIPIAQEQSLVARAARARQAVIVNDVRSDPGWLPNPLLPDTASEMAVPMIVGNQLLGVLDVQSERINAFSEEDASIQTTLASQIAVAIQNAHSFSQSQRQAKREAEVNIITQKIQNAPTIEAAMQVAARELGHALGMRPTLVALDPSALRGEAGNDHGE